ncbi:LysR family transcriptional regulator [Rhizobiales bacterium RZME27]|uniref:LysR family transcriptional regulator n=1 Tax=Endobacterium cereale TaxID=2663029 RepID=A0A6A8A811_9HYPH|nr:LysR family transcriptional regulator [Endobacterium cereale]MEB2847814.1 LysR family transcriptional regulator [Endobacterium cereale]MQY46849.1 LysR family transcriptional regulator [Endobacterium cereale]
MIDLRNIETFFWAATLGSLRAASEKLGTTQPAVSQRIAALELALGVKLFDRAARGVRLTAKGQELLAHAEQLIQARNDLIQAARDHTAMTGRLNLGVAETIVQTWLPTLIAEIHGAYPNLTLEIEVDTSEMLQSHLMSRKIDLAFLMGPVLEPRVENRPLCTYPLAWIAKPGLYPANENISLDTISALPVITYGSNSTPYRQVRDMLQRYRISSPRMYGSASLSMIARMALDGIGTAVITPIFLGAELDRGELEILKVDAGPLKDLHFTASWIEGPGSHAARVVTHMAQQIAQNSAGNVLASRADEADT